MKPHPASLLTPPLTEAEMTALEEDIKKNGQVDDIITCDGMVLDGNHRLKVLTKLGIKPRFKEWHKNGVQNPQDFVIAKLQGRHLTTSQKACVGVLIWQTIKGDARYEHMRALHDRRTGLTHAEYRAKYPKPDRSKRRCSDKYAKVALSMGVSVASLTAAIRVHTLDKGIFNEILKGKISLNKGYLSAREKAGDSETGGNKRFEDLAERKITASHELKIPSPLEAVSDIIRFIGDMTDLGWILQLKCQNRQYYVHWYGNGFPIRTNWDGYLPDGEFRRAIIASACERLKIKANPIQYSK